MAKLYYKYDYLSIEKMIGKILLDKLEGIKKNSETGNPKIKPIIEVNDKKIKELRKKLQDCNSTVKIDTVIDESEFAKVEGLSAHIKELYEKGAINKLNAKNDVAPFVQNQYYTDIANQAHGFKGVNEAIQKYNKLTDDASKSKLVDTIAKSNASLGEYLSGLEDADGKFGKASIGLGGYAGSLATATLKTVALNVATTAMNAAISMGISAAVSFIVSGITHLINAEEEVAERAQELGENFKSTKSEIDEYKEKISELYEIINNNSSSFNDVTEARKSLLQIQDEMIEKYGTEKGAINEITSAINGQVGALDALTEKEWQETKNDFNDGGFWNGVSNWFSGYDNNIDRMVDEMENASVRIQSYTDLPIELEKALEDAGYTYYDYEDYNVLTLSGNLEQIYEDILNIQNIASQYNAPADFLNELTKKANNAKETLDNYREMWNQYILQDRIFENNSLADSFNEINNTSSNYQDALVSGDKEAIEDALA